MKFLQEINKLLSEKTNSKDMSMLPTDIIAELQYKIRKGSQDLRQRWANALELVHQAYHVVGVQRPTPEMTEAWKQYETLIQYAVQRLAKDRGMNDDWRMSASVFQESAQINKYRVTIDLMDPQMVIVETSSVQSIIDQVQNTLSPDLEMKVVTLSENQTQLKFSAFGICKKQTVLIEKI
mgnify:CR=1 FL=1